MNLEEFLAKCLRCGSKLLLEEHLVDYCPKCNAEFKEQGDFESMEKLLLRSIEEQDNHILIIPKKKLDELKMILQGSIHREKNL